MNTRKKRLKKIPKKGYKQTEEHKRNESIAQGGRPEGQIMKTIKKIQNTLSNEEKKELTSAKACMLVSCQPSVELLEKVVNKHPNIDLEKTKKYVQEIEKRLFKRNLYRKSSVVVALAIYLGNNDIKQSQASSIMKDYGSCTGVSLRNLLKILGFKITTERIYKPWSLERRKKHSETMKKKHANKKQIEPIPEGLKNYWMLLKRIV